RRQQRGEHPQGGRLACPVRAEHRHQLPFCRLEADAVDRLDRATRCLEPFGQPLHCYHPASYPVHRTERVRLYRTPYGCQWSRLRSLHGLSAILVWMSDDDRTTGHGTDPLRSIRLMWDPPAPAKGRKAKLSLEQIVDTAIVNADQSGVDALSMRNVAATLGAG